MPAMNMVQALNSAMDLMLARDRNVVVFGEDLVGFRETLTIGVCFSVVDDESREARHRSNLGEAL